MFLFFEILIYHRWNLFYGMSNYSFIPLYMSHTHPALLSSTDISHLRSLHSRPILPASFPPDLLSLCPSSHALSFLNNGAITNLSTHMLLKSFHLSSSTIKSWDNASGIKGLFGRNSQVWRKGVNEGWIGSWRTKRHWQGDCFVLYLARVFERQCSTHIWGCAYHLQPTIGGFFCFVAQELLLTPNFRIIPGSSLGTCGRPGIKPKLALCKTSA